MKITERLRTFGITHRLAASALTATACIGFLTGCATTETASNTVEHPFKFTVFHYKEPVDINNWTYNPALNDGPEGASVNVATLIVNGDVDQWLGRWNPAERPTLSAEERACVVQKWAPLKDGHIAFLNRIVSGATTIVEFSVTTTDQKQLKLQVPLSHVNGEWELTSVDPNSDYLNWEASENKIVSDMESKPLAAYLNQGPRTPAQASL